MKCSRKRKRFVRFVKGVSTVIAVLLMIAIAVIASIVAYAWVMGYFHSNSVRISKAIQIQSAYYTGQYLGVYVQNIGQGKATLIASQCFYVDGALRQSASVNPSELQQASYTLQESDIALVVDAISLNLGQTVKIKVVTSEGTFAGYSFTVNTFQGQNPYSLTLIADPPAGGSVNASNNGPYRFGDVVQLTATANSGWSFSYWSGDASGSTNPTTIVINGTNTVTATFTQNEYALTLDIVGSGSVSKLPDQATYHYGDSVQLQATAAPGWVFSGWSGDLTSTTNPDSVIIDETPQVTATFIQNECNLTMYTVGQGSVQPGNDTYLPGTVVNIQAINAAGWTFAGWSGDVSGSRNTTITMSGPMTVNATFTQNTLDHVVIAPKTSSVVAGASPAYTLTAYDAVGNSWDVTGSATWSIDVGAGGSWSANTYTSANAGIWTVTGSYSSLSDTAQLTVTNAAVDHVVIAPKTSSVVAGDSQAYTLTAYDAVGNSWDVTGSATWSIDVGAGGSWSANTYTSANAGIWTVTGSYSSLSDTAQQTVNPAAASKLVYTAGAGQSITVSTVSSVITVQLQDPSGNPISAGAGGVVVSLTTNSSGRFYSDSGRNNRIYSVTIASGTNSANFYYYDSSAGTPTLTASSGGLTPATTTFTINSYYLVFRNGGQTLVTGQVSQSITIRRYDSSGSSYYGPTITVTLTPSASGKFCSNPDGTGTITTVTITNGNRDSGTFYYVDSAVGTPTLTASSTGYTSATTTFTIQQPHLAFTAGASQTLTSGVVSAQITVQRRDANNNAYSPSTTATVSLTSSSGGVFYSDAAGTNVITSVNIASGQSSASFYYKDTVVGSPTIAASATGYTPATTTLTIYAAGSKLAFIAGTSQSLTRNHVSSVITVQLQDSSGNPISASGALTVSLASSSSGGTFYSDAGGNTQITSVTIASGASSANFYYADSSAGTPTLTASSGSLTSATTQFTINSYYLGFRTGGGQTLAAGQVSSSITIRRYNSDGSSYSPSTAITVALTTTSPGGHFSANSDGSGTITSITIASGSSTSGTFYYVDSTVGTPVLTASFAGYTPGTTTFTIRMPVLVFSAGAGQTLTAGSISARITVQCQDGSGNAYNTNTAITVNLASNSGTGVFYSDAAGTQVITQITIASGADHAYIYYKDTIVGSPTLTASATGYTPATTTFTVLASGAKLVFTAGTAQTITRNHVSSVITVQLQDSSGNPISASGALTVSLASSSSGGTFYSDAGGNTQITSVTIASGASSANFYYADSSAGTPTLTASSGSLTPATTTFTINNYQLVYTSGVSQTLTVGVVSAQIRVQRQTYSGSAYSTGTITINLLSTSPTGVFYSDASGTTVITTVTISSGSSYSSYFYYKDTAVGTPTLTVSTTTAGYTSATTTFTITGPASQLVFTAGTSQSIFTNSVSSVITVQRQDAAGHGVTSGGAITVSLAKTSTTGSFYANSDGSGGAITQITIASGASSANFYYEDTAAGSSAITASSGSLTPATTTFTITQNVVPAGDFESPGTWTSGGSAYASLASDDPIPPHSGSIFLEIDTSIQTSTAYGSYTSTFSVPISSIPNAAGSLSLWVYNNGYAGVAGYYSFQIALTASDGTQLIYWWGNTPATAPTETANTKVINMGTLPGMFTTGQWVQLSRNIVADWTSKGLSSSTSLTSIIIRADGYQSGSTHYGQEIFIDDVQIQ